MDELHQEHGEKLRLRFLPTVRCYVLTGTQPYFLQSRSDSRCTTLLFSNLDFTALEIFSKMSIPKLYHFFKQMDPCRWVGDAVFPHGVNHHIEVLAGSYELIKADTTVVMKPLH
jgi:hypothetical protein